MSKKRERKKFHTQTHDHFLCSDVFLHMQKTLKKPFGHLYDNHPIKNKAPSRCAQAFFFHSFLASNHIEERLGTIWSRKGKKQKKKEKR